MAGNERVGGSENEEPTGRFQVAKLLCTKALVNGELAVFAKVKAPLELYDIGKGSLKSQHVACRHE